MKATSGRLIIVIKHGLVPPADGKPQCLPCEDW